MKPEEPRFPNFLPVVWSYIVWVLYYSATQFCTVLKYYSKSWSRSREALPKKAYLTTISDGVKAKYVTTMATSLRRNKSTAP